jgi:hypothetical protein
VAGPGHGVILQIEKESLWQKIQTGTSEDAPMGSLIASVQTIQKHGFFEEDLKDLLEGAGAGS